MKKITEHYQWARQYFFDNPEASIDAAAREAKACHKGLHKTELSTIRREVKLAIAQGHERRQVLQQSYSARPLAKGPIIRKPTPVAASRATPKKREPFNPPHIRLHDRDEEKNVTVAEVQAAPPVEVAPPPEPAVTPPPPMVVSDIETEKLKWLYDFCEQTVATEPTLTVHQVNAACQQKFGSGIWLPKVTEALNLARAMHGIPIKVSKRKKMLTPKHTAIPTGAEMLQQQNQKTQRDRNSQLRALELAAKELARQMKLTSTRKVDVTVDADGGVSFTFERHEITTGGGRLSLD